LSAGLQAVLLKLACIFNEADFRNTACNLAVKSTNRYIATDICRISLMWEVLTLTSY
jgi:hypothetical protein